ncbi:MAG TPA: OB-fold nucleic acid binding domain-containing protein, partial [Clostridiales bacterium]|nr:OB-fold nucleic acid binding domain-containing protein [Clostridiales bacterium]
MSEDLKQNAPLENEGEETLDTNALRKVRLDKLDALKAAGADPFEITLAEQTAHAAEIVEKFEELENTDVSICGRIMTWRDMGKANFIDIHDRSGRIQVYVRQDDIGEDAFAEFKKWDIGDLVEIKGF